VGFAESGEVNIAASIRAEFGAKVRKIEHPLTRLRLQRVL